VDMSRQEIFATCRSGVAQVSFERGRDRLTAGSAFLIPGGLVTNSHVLRDATFDVAIIRFDNMNPADGIRLARDTCFSAIAYESPRDEHDLAYLQLNEPEFAGRHTFTFGDSTSLKVGEVGFCGYPFQMQQLTCHVGSVSSLHRRGRVDIIQIDGSVNGGNSGGPLIELNGGQVVGIVSRAEVGFLADQFDELIRALQQNVEVLQRSPSASILIGGIDPVQGLLVSQAAMHQIAGSLRRSANVGIGYAFGTNHVRGRIA
jgi:V8-like Glu-specific endopeptidase